jgi:hypothetical protein
VEVKFREVALAKADLASRFGQGDDRTSHRPSCGVSWKIVISTGWYSV